MKTVNLYVALETRTFDPHSDVHKRVEGILHDLVELLSLGSVEVLMDAMSNEGLYFTQAVYDDDQLPSVHFTYGRYEGTLAINELSDEKPLNVSPPSSLKRIDASEDEGYNVYHHLIRLERFPAVDIKPYVDYFNEVVMPDCEEPKISFKQWSTRKVDKEQLPSERPASPTDRLVEDAVVSDVLATLALVVNKTLPLDGAMEALSKKYPEDGKRIATRLLFVLSSGELDKEI